jgi:hypothetical protein
MKIERGIPSPGDFRCYPWRHMQLGDSFFAAKPPKVVSAAACCWAKRNPGYKFITRKVRENGVCGTRCWRVAPTLALVEVRKSA